MYMLSTNQWRETNGMKVLRMTDALTSSILYPPLAHPPFPPPHFHIGKEPAFPPINSTGRGNSSAKFTRDNWLAPIFPL